MVDNYLLQVEDSVCGSHLEKRCLSEVLCDTVVELESSYQKADATRMHSVEFFYQFDIC